MLHVDSGMGPFPSSSLHPASPTEAPALQEISLKGFIRGQTLPRTDLHGTSWCVKGCEAGEPIGRIQGYYVQLRRQRIGTEKMPSLP